MLGFEIRRESNFLRRFYENIVENIKKFSYETIVIFSRDSNSAD